MTTAGGRWPGLAIVTVLGMIWAWSAGLPAAQAHAIIIDSSPRDEESVPPPPRLVLRFNGRLEKGLCTVEVIGQNRKTIALMRQEPDTALDTIAYALPRLKPGAYQARWKVMSADGHVTEGTVRFTVVGGEPARTR